MKTKSKLAFVYSMLALLALGITRICAQTGTQPSEVAPLTHDRSAQHDYQHQHPTKTTGVIDDAIGNVATSAGDANWATQRGPTASKELRTNKSALTIPDITRNSSGTNESKPSITSTKPKAVFRLFRCCWALKPYGVA